MEKVKYKYCSLKSCKISTRDKASFFEWPKNQETRVKWKEFLIKNGNKNVEKVLEVKLCEYHFAIDDINITATSKRLKKGSVPVFAHKKV